MIYKANYQRARKKHEQSNINIMILTLYIRCSAPNYIFFVHHHFFRRNLFYRLISSPITINYLFQTLPIDMIVRSSDRPTNFPFEYNTMLSCCLLLVVVELKMLLQQQLLFIPNQTKTKCHQPIQRKEDHEQLHRIHYGLQRVKGGELSLSSNQSVFLS